MVDFAKLSGRLVMKNGAALVSAASTTCRSALSFRLEVSAGDMCQGYNAQVFVVGY